MHDERSLASRLSPPNDSSHVFQPPSSSPARAQSTRSVPPQSPATCSAPAQQSDSSITAEAILIVGSTSALRVSDWGLSKLVAHEMLRPPPGALHAEQPPAKGTGSE